jgi:hypothetical protein
MTRPLRRYRALPQRTPDGESLFALLERPAWQADAACREHPEIDWFRTMGDNHPAAKRVYAGCLVRNPCQQWRFHTAASCTAYGVS